MRHLVFFTAALIATIWIFDVGQSHAQDCDSGTFAGAFDTEVVVPQNLTCEERQDFWFTDQGSQIIPYLWFLNLEQADSTEKFAAPSNMNRLGYLPQKQTGMNPDELPIGFTKGSAKNNRDYGKISDTWLGVSCSACHTGQVEYQGDKFLIDGAPTMGDFETTFVELADAMQATLSDEEKFDAFASAVIADSKIRDISGTKSKSKLRKQLQDVTKIRTEWNARNRGRTPYGHGRLDALGAIYNETAATALGDPGNRDVANAPVSYPFLWDTAQHDKVQWNGSVENGKLHGPLGRNAGEVLGVFGHLDLQRGQDKAPGHISSVNMTGLAKLEELIWKMQSPLWADTTLPKIDEKLAEAGAPIYKELCSACHQEIDRSDVNRTVQAVMNSVDGSDDYPGLGTDRTMAENFLVRTAIAPALTGEFLRYSELLSEGKKFDSEHENSVPKIMVLGYSVGGSIASALQENPLVVVNAMIAGRPVEFQQEAKELIKNFVNNQGLESDEDKKNAFQLLIVELNKRLSKHAVAGSPQSDPSCNPVGLCYKARPLNGIWATGPYLHNGSVRTLRQLLLPAEQRDEYFMVGSREFDADGVGFVNAGPFVLNTKEPGNSNKGHEGPVYGTDILANDPEKLNALLEYLKQL